jgi:hypothetical protein
LVHFIGYREHSRLLESSIAEGRLVHVVGIEPRGSRRHGTGSWTGTWFGSIASIVSSSETQPQDEGEDGHSHEHTDDDVPLFLLIFVLGNASARSRENAFV